MSRPRRCRERGGGAKVGGGGGGAKVGGGDHHAVSSIYIWSENLVAESEAKDGGN